MVNNAGVYEFVLLEEVTEQQFHRMFDVNVLGMLLVTQEALKHFNSDGGSIINIGSLASSLTPPTAVVYNATKGAVDAITRTLAKELGPRKIRVNSINPGMVITEGAIAGGYTEGVVGYAFRPVSNDRLNTLVKYTYFYNVPTTDQFGLQNTATEFLQDWRYGIPHDIVGETQTFVHSKWRTAEEIAAWLAQLPDSANSGDIYALLALLP